MPTERFTFPGHGGSDLSARLDLPEGPVYGAALFAHCFTCSGDIAAARRISARLAGQGIAVLRFDFTGLGLSAGDFADTTFSTNVGDLVAAARSMADRGLAPSLLVGHSLGGAAVIAAAAEIDGIRAVATLGAPFDPEHVTRAFRHDLDRIEEEGRADVTLAGRQIPIGQAFVDDVASVDLAPALERLGAALLVLHAPTDDVVGIDNASAIFTAARHPKSFVSLSDTDHLISDPTDAEYAADMIAQWAGRYLDIRRSAPPPGTPEGIVRVSESDPSGYLQDVTSGPHHVLADEPAAYGGSNRGLTPYGLVSAGLGACTSMTIRMYARRKGWPLSHVSVDIRHGKVHAQDATDAQSGKVDHFLRTITLEGDLTSEQTARLMEIADRCPVHRTMERSSTVETHLAGNTD